MHRIILAAVFARANAGSSSAAKMAIIAMTTKSSIRVKPERPLIEADINVWEPYLSSNIATCRLQALFDSDLDARGLWGEGYMVATLQGCIEGRELIG